MDPKEKRLADCQRVIGYFFADPTLLETALTHSSLRSPDRDCNERLEFLGDSVLGLVITEELYHLLPDSAEGEMTRIKSAVVSRKSLYRASTQLGLAEYADYARGVGKRDELPTSVVANLVESVIGAIYLDAGYYPAREFVLRHLGDEIEDVLNDRGAKNFKSLLQHEVQQSTGITPHYRTVEEEGPDHDKIFIVAAVIQGKEWGRASGANKKEAEQDAARKALEAWSRRGRGRRRLDAGEALETEGTAKKKKRRKRKSEKKKGKKAAEAPAATEAKAGTEAAEAESKPKRKKRASRKTKKEKAAEAKPAEDVVEAEAASEEPETKHRGRKKRAAKKAADTEAKPRKKRAKRKKAAAKDEPAEEPVAKAAPKPSSETEDAAGETAPRPALRRSRAKPQERPKAKAPARRPARKRRARRKTAEEKAAAEEEVQEQAETVAVEPSVTEAPEPAAARDPEPAAAPDPEPTPEPAPEPPKRPERLRPAPVASVPDKAPAPTKQAPADFGAGIFEGDALPELDDEPTSPLLATDPEDANVHVKGRAKAPAQSEPDEEDGFAI